MEDIYAFLAALGIEYERADHPPVYTCEEAEVLQCHPLVNTSTLVLKREDVARLLETTGHGYQTLAVPAREE